MRSSSKWQINTVYSVPQPPGQMKPPCIFSQAQMSQWKHLRVSFCTSNSIAMYNESTQQPKIGDPFCRYSPLHQICIGTYLKKFSLKVCWRWRSWFKSDGNGPCRLHAASRKLPVCIFSDGSGISCCIRESSLNGLAWALYPEKLQMSTQGSWVMIKLTRVKDKKEVW